MKSNFILRFSIFLIILFSMTSSTINSQQVEVDGTLSVTQMAQDNSQDNIVIQNDDGTLGIRQSSSLNNPQGGIDTIRNLASDLALAKHMCECQNFPPFMIRSLLEQGYTESELVEAGIPLVLIRNADYIVDGDGNIYTSIDIGNQTWLRENLKTTSKIDGTPISLSTSSSMWTSANSANIPSYAYVNSGNLNTFTEDYGLLYNWYTVEDDDVCPIGYRVPTINEWFTLASFIGSGNAALVKEKGFDHWIQPNQLSTNATGFNGRGTGVRSSSWNYTDFKFRTNLWSITENSGDNTKARYVFLRATFTSLSEATSLSKGSGHSIRCLKN